MLEEILKYERSTFFLLNGSQSDYLDALMWLWSGKVVWLPLAFFIIAVLVYKKDWKESLLILVAIALVITCCDQFASHVCKPLFTRFRPTHHPDFMDQVKIVFNYRGGRYGFISSHAANAFGFSVFMALLFRYRLFTYTILAWAVITAYSRIYLGVHFISDVVPGAIAGIFFGWLVYRIYLYARHSILHIPDDRLTRSVYSDYRKRLIVYGIAFTALMLVVFCEPLVHFLHS